MEDIFERFRQEIQNHLSIKNDLTKKLEEELNIDTSEFEGLLTEAQKEVKADIMAQVEERMLLNETVIHFKRVIYMQTIYKS